MRKKLETSCANNSAKRWTNNHRQREQLRESCEQPELGRGPKTVRQLEFALWKKSLRMVPLLGEFKFGSSFFVKILIKKGHSKPKFGETACKTPRIVWSSH